MVKQTRAEICEDAGAGWGSTITFTEDYGSCFKPNMPGRKNLLRDSNSPKQEDQHGITDTKEQEGGG